MENPYAILGVNYTLSIEEIERVYRRLAFKHHPDRHANSSDAERQKQERIIADINVAWDLIKSGKATKPVEVKTPQKPVQRTVKATVYEKKPFEIIPTATRLSAKDYLVYISAAQAFSGIDIIIPTESKTYRVHLPNGTPPHLKLSVKTHEGDITVLVAFLQSSFKIKSIDSMIPEKCVVGGEEITFFRIKDIHCELVISKSPTSVDMIGLDGKYFTIKIPKHFLNDSSTGIIEVPDQGYYDWDQTNSKSFGSRGKLIVHYRFSNTVDLSWNSR